MGWDQWTILLLGPTAVWLSMVESLELRRWGPILGLVGQLAWFYTLISHQQWGGVVAGFAYTASWSYGLWTMWKEEIKRCLSKKPTAQSIAS